jgi:hypothetical protein
VRSLVAIGLLTFALAVGVFAVVSSHSQPQPPLPKRQAVPSALRNAEIRSFLRGSNWDEARVLALDRTHWRVTFFAGPRYVADAAVDSKGRVDATQDHPAGGHPSGSSILWNRPLLLLLVAVALAALAVRPLASLRNLDALVVTTGFTISSVLLDDRLVAAHVYTGALTLAYVAVRLGARALGPARAHATQPLLPPHRLVRLGTIALVIAAAMIVISSRGASDVAFAGLAGGTLINHGVLPYGNLPADVVHGDTYPILTYVLYMPFAAISPVRDSFDALDGGLWLNLIALVAGALMLARRERSHVLAWLAFPPVLLAASGGGNDVPVAAFVIAALVWATRTQLSVALLTLSGLIKIAPASALIPWLARLRGRALARALLLVVALVAASVVLILLLGGADGVHRAFDALRFQFERGSWFSVWRQSGSEALRVILQALTVAAAVTVGVAARREPDMSLARLAALGGVIVALLQLSANYWTFAYLPWLFPFILYGLFPPAPRRSRPLAPPVP